MEEESRVIEPLQKRKVVAFLKNFTKIVRSADKEESLENKKTLFDLFIKEVIFDGERFLIVMRTTDDPDDGENGEKKEASRKKFELLRFGELCPNEFELLKMDSWRYFYLIDKICFEKY